jgi:anti-sigma factor RsiW
MYHDAFHDDVLFDRLVDGELSPTERRELVGSLEHRPGGWRKCALAFLEAQSWRGDLKQIVRESDAALTPAYNLPRAEGTRGRATWWFATAATVLMAFTLGLAMRKDGFTLRSGTPIPRGEAAATSVPPSGSVKSPLAGGPDEALTLWVRNEQGQAQPLRVPLVDAATLDEQLGVEFRPGLSDAARSRLRDRGYDVESKQRYAPLWLENGRPMIVPVEDTRIVPVSGPVY